METKQCKQCGEDKLLTDFPANGKGDAKHPRNYCRACDSASSKLWRQNNPEAARELAWKGTLRRRYGLTIEQYQDKLEEQDFACAICGSKTANNRDTRLYVDHDHSTGQIRSLLCGICNAGLGSFRDDPKLLLKAVDYLAYWRGEAKG